MTRIKGDVCFAICVIVGALLYLYADMQLPTVRIADTLGPKAFPALVGIGLIASSLLLLYENWQKSRSVLSEKIVPVAPGDAHRRYPLILIGVVAWTALYYGCFEDVGYLVSTIVFLFGLLSYFHRRHHWINLAVAVGFPFAIDTLFSRFLNVPMPPGILSNLFLS